jgi:hypothetical protein
MDTKLQLIMLVSSILFLIYVVAMVRSKKIDLKYTLAWLLAAFSFIAMSLFPSLLEQISSLLSIKEPVNALFLIIIFFMLLIIFTLTVATSRSASRVKILTQEIGIMKLQLADQKKQIDKLNSY